MLSIFAQLYLQDHVSDSRQLCISWGYHLGKKHGDVMSLSLSFCSLSVYSCLSLFPAAYLQLIECVVFCFALFVPRPTSAQLFVFRLAKHLQLVASGCEYQIPLAFASTSGGKAPAGRRHCPFLLRNRNHDLSAKLPCESCCSGFHVDRLGKDTNVCSKHLG